MTRSEEREEMMKMLYQMGMQSDFSEAAYTHYTELQTSMKISKYYRTVYEKLSENISEIDGKINRLSENWKTSRMPQVDLAILRLALSEIDYIENIPVSVSINEAVNLAKKFSTEKSSKFINGVLGKAVRENEGK